MNSNYSNFVNAIIKSRYGAYFINRFMDKHNISTSLDNIKHAPGNDYWNKPTWLVKKDILAQENKSLVDEGLYWINPEKLVYFHDKFHGVDSSETNAKPAAPQKFQHPERFVIFRPDFLYLIYALLKDPEFQRDDVAPIKVTFHGNVYVPDYSNKFAPFEIKGDPKEDAKQNKGLTASNSEITSSEYNQTPNGDQTYTYIKANVKGLDEQVNFMGIKQDRRGSYVKLYKNGKIINHLLYKDKFKDGSYPLIINHYTAKKLELSVGSTLKAKIHNTSDRFSRQAQENLSAKEVLFRIIEIYDSYYKPAFFIGQKHANEILGLDPEYGYNGIYTKEFRNQTDLPIQLTKAISGYSPSNIYAKQKIGKHDSQFQAFLRTVPYNVFLENVSPTHPFTPPNNEAMLRS